MPHREGPPAVAQPAAPGLAYRLLNRALDVRADEVATLGWAWLYILAVLSSYYILRPIRDQFGVAGGVNNLPWLFTGTQKALRHAEAQRGGSDRIGPTIDRARRLGAHRLRVDRCRTIAVSVHAKRDEQLRSQADRARRNDAHQVHVGAPNMMRNGRPDPSKPPACRIRRGATRPE